MMIMRYPSHRPSQARAGQSIKSRRSIAVFIIALFAVVGQMALFAQGLIFQLPRVQFFDSTGAVLNGGKLCSYQAGTSTPQNTYSDQALTMANANPIILSAGGVFPGPVYLVAASYKFVLLTAGTDNTCATGTQVWSADQVPGGYAASVLIAGTVNSARLGSGTANAGTFLTGGQTWVQGDIGTCDLRLTLTSGTPITSTDVTAATTVYVSPLKGGRCSFYDGSSTWTFLTNTELNITVPASTNTNYDVFCRNNSGAISCDTTAWTNDTTRATGLATVSGIYVKNGDSTRRYIGSFRTTGVSGQTEDSAAKRFVWNYYDRVARSVIRTESTSSWNYTTATWRQANANTANQVDILVGVAEDAIGLSLIAEVTNNTPVQVAIAIAQDSTTNPGGVFSNPQTLSTGSLLGVSAYFSTIPSVGRHFFAWLEISAAAGTTTWRSNNNQGVSENSGLVGLWRS